MKGDEMTPRERARQLVNQADWPVDEDAVTHVIEAAVEEERHWLIKADANVEERAEILCIRMDKLSDSCATETEAYEAYMYAARESLKAAIEDTKTEIHSIYYNMIPQVKDEVKFEEREACAKVVEEHDCKHIIKGPMTIRCYCPDPIAATIRGRK